MSARKKYALVICGIVLAAYLLFAGPVIRKIVGGGTPQSALAQTQGCVPIGAPSQIPAPTLITFDDLPNNTPIGLHYVASHGVRFDLGTNPEAIAFADIPANVHTPPNVAFYNPTPPVSSAGFPLRIIFDQPKNYVGMYVGNGDTRTVATLTGYDITGALICTVVFQGVGDPVNTFLGFYDPEGTIIAARLDYGDTSLSETIDDLIFSPARAAPTRTPLPTWTPVPTAAPTLGPTPTATPIIPMYAYQAINPNVILAVIKPDLSIHGIEITQGMQCFNTGAGLSGCPNNSLIVVNKKDTTARIYLKVSGSYSSYNNVPVRLHIFANNVEYTADAMGKATTSINQANRDDAEIYFNVNFSNDVLVEFYAEVDPNHVISETDESNNRYPTSGTIPLTFRNGVTKKVVGYRLHYHPTGYAGTQDAAGWAVNGGAADWWEQVLPMRNNGINYSLRSGYLDWTTNLGTGDGQHALIQNLNALWILENVFSFWFSGAFTGAQHVYGFAPSAGYSGGHADMPIYPHAGGYGVVGIGSDAPGTNTDNPGSGALIFGHELTHDYDLKHTNTADSCGSSDSTTDFPYSSSNIQEFGFNPFTGKIYNPNNTHDLMSYCPSGGSKLGWIAPFTWNRMFSVLPPLAPAGRNIPMAASSELPVPSASVESLVINATVFNPIYGPPQAGNINEMHRIGTGLDMFPDIQGMYAIELRDAFNNLLASYSFNADFKSEYDVPGGPFPPDPAGEADINLVVPWVNGTTNVALVHQIAQNTPFLDLDTVPLSDNPPVVTFTSPTAIESWTAGSVHTLMWNGFDADGDSLIYSLFYSYDGGSTWELVQDGISATQYDVHTDAMKGGSDVRFRVEASDGINTGLGETAQAITIPNHAPSLLILNPLGSQIVQPGALLVLQGSANDFEDGTLPDESLVWSDDVQGGLGTGPSVPVNTLLPGKHVITLTASDSLNVTSSQPVTIFIGYPSYLPEIEH